MLAQAKVLHQQGNLRKVAAPTSRVRSKSAPLRVQPVEAEIPARTTKPPLAAFLLGVSYLSSLSCLPLAKKSRAGGDSGSTPLRHPKTRQTNRTSWTADEGRRLSKRLTTRLMLTCTRR